MRSTLKFLLLLPLFILITTSCGDDTPDCDDEAAINQLLENGANRVFNAVELYIGDPSNNNCENLRDTYADWIDDMENLQDCADDAGQGQEFREAISDARSALDDVPC